MSQLIYNPPVPWSNASWDGQGNLASNSLIQSSVQYNSGPVLSPAYPPYNVYMAISASTTFQLPNAVNLPAGYIFKLFNTGSNGAAVTVLGSDGSTFITKLAQDIVATFTLFNPTGGAGASWTFAATPLLVGASPTNPQIASYNVSSMAGSTQVYTTVSGNNDCILTNLSPEFTIFDNTLGGATGFQRVHLPSVTSLTIGRRFTVVHKCIGTGTNDSVEVFSAGNHSFGSYGTGNTYIGATFILCSNAYAGYGEEFCWEVLPIPFFTAT